MDELASGATKKDPRCFYQRGSRLYLPTAFAVAERIKNNFMPKQTLA
jgi:hypothetical protein